MLTVNLFFWKRVRCSYLKDVGEPMKRCCKPSPLRLERLETAVVVVEPCPVPRVADTESDISQLKKQRKQQLRPGQPHLQLEARLTDHLVNVNMALLVVALINKENRRQSALCGGIPRKCEPGEPHTYTYSHTRTIKIILI